MSSERKLASGEYLFREGETAEFAYILNSGVIEVVKSGLDGELVLAEISQGALFGEMALIDGSPRSASARAKEECVLTEVRSDAFEQYIRTKPDAAIRIMRNLSSELRAANTEIAHKNSSDNVSGGTGIDLLDLQDENQEEVLDTDAIYNQKPARMILGYVFLILVALMAAVAFGFLGHVDTTISSRGKLTTKAPNVVVQASGSAVIDAVLVERGEYVEANQIVAKLNDTFTRTNYMSNSERINAATGRLKRLKLERNAVEFGRPITKKGKVDRSNQEIL